MPSIPLAKSSYSRPDNPPLVVRNMVFEPDPANQEDQASLITRPALIGAAPDTNGSPTRAIFYLAGTFSNNVFGIMGTQVWGTLPGGGSSGVRGGDPIAGTNPCTMAAVRSTGPGLALIASDLLYKIDQSVSGNVVAVTFVDNSQATSVDVIGGRFVISRGDNLAGGTGYPDRFYWSDLNSANINALSYATAESAPDRLVCVKVVNDELWLFGQASIEVWGQTGDPDMPFQRINGRLFGIGCVNRGTVTTLEDSLFWVGGKEAQVYQTAPNPVVISDASVEGLLRLALLEDPNGTTLSAFAFACDNHAYLVLNMGSQGSMAYDLTTKAWSRWNTFGRVDLSARYATSVGSGVYMTGSDAGRFQLPHPEAGADATYDGTPIPIDRQWSGSLDLSTTIRCDNVILDCTVGSAASYPPDPQVLLRTSDDRGRTWSDWEPTPLGHRGDFFIQPTWTRLGLMSRPGRVFNWRCTENLPFMVRRAKFNERV